MSGIDDFIQARRKANDDVLGQDHLGIKRFFNLDEAAYRDGALPGDVKELCGLVASLVLRCNDCVDYHLVQCLHPGVVAEIRGVGLMIGVELTRDATPAVKALRERGVLLTKAGDTVVRLLPPLVIKAADVRAFLAAFDAALQPA